MDMRKIFHPKPRLLLSAAFFPVLLSLAGCAGTMETETDYYRAKIKDRKEEYKKSVGIIMASEKPATPHEYQGVRIFNSPYHSVFRAVKETILYKDYPIQLSDERGGIIESAYRLHDGLFTLGFIGARVRSKIVALLREMAPQQVEVVLRIMAEKEEEDGTWSKFPVGAYNLDLIDSDSYDMFFYYISKRLDTQGK